MPIDDPYIPSFRTGGVFQSDRVRAVVGKLLRNNPVQKLWHRPSAYANIGCGRNVFDGFLNIDHSWNRGVLCWDITKRIPIADSSLDGVFFEHALEHFEWQTALDVILPEVRRILRPGGTLRVVVPDAEIVIDHYLSAREAGRTSHLWGNPRPSAGRLDLTPMAEVNNAFRRIYEPYQVGHKFMYDFQTLEHFLWLAGFRDIVRTEFRKGRDPHLLIDYEKRKEESLYVEASA